MYSFIFGVGVGVGLVMGYKGNQEGMPCSNEDLKDAEKLIGARLIHKGLFDKLDKRCKEGNLEKIKEIAKTYPECENLSKVHNMKDLLFHLEVKGAIDVGQYDKLIELMEKAELRIVIDDIRETAKAIHNITQGSVSSKEPKEDFNLLSCCFHSSKADLYDALIICTPQTKTIVRKYRDYLENGLVAPDVRVEVKEIGSEQCTQITTESLSYRYRNIFVCGPIDQRVFIWLDMHHPRMVCRYLEEFPAVHFEKDRCGNFDRVPVWIIDGDVFKNKYIKHLQALIREGRMG